MNPWDEDKISDYEGQANFEAWQRKRRPSTAADDFLMGDGPDVPDTDDAPWVEARYDGECENRGCDIIAGVTMIKADGYGGWVCCE